MSASRKTFETRPLNRRAAFISWRQLAFAAVLLLALLVGILIAYRSRGSDVDRGMSALITAFGDRRLIEPRLSGGFKGGKFKPSRDDRSGINSSELGRARVLIMDSLAKGEPSAPLAYARLLLSENEKLPEALKYLRRVLVASPESAEAHNDLGVFLIQQDKVEDAIDEFEAALKYKVDMAEALFNRALCYQRLLLKDSAIADLNRFLEIERDPGWRDEARRRRDEVSAPVSSAKPPVEVIEDLNKALAGDFSQAREILDRNYDVVRKYFYFDLAQQYLRSADTPDQAATDLALLRMENISRLAIEAKGDRDMADTVKRLMAVPQRNRAAELRLFRDYKEALDLFSTRRYDEAQVTLERLKNVFQQRGDSQFKAKMEYSIAGALYASRHFKSSITLLKAILPLFRASGWRYHQAQTLDLLGLVYSRLGQDSKAIKYLQQSCELFQEIDEPVAVPLQYAGVAYWHLGDFDKALGHLHRSTDLFLKQGSRSTELANNYLNTADIYRLLDRSQLALLFAGEALRYSNKANDASRAAQALSFEAVEHARAKQFDLAEEKITQALEQLNRVGAAERAYTQPLILVRAGDVAMRRGDITGALQHYTNAESLTSHAEGDPILHVHALRGRADAYAKSGQRDRAHKDLNDAVRLIETYRENLAGRVHRIEFLSASQGVFDQMIALDADEPERASEAFEMSERSHGRELLDEFAPANRPDKRTTEPLSLDDVQAALPPDLTLLVYSVTSERTYLFLIRHSGFEIATSTATTTQLDRLVSDYVSEVKTKAPGDGLSEKARVLYQLLIEPVRERLAGITHLCIVPDKSLQLLPMAALKDPSDRYLVESFGLICAPSASVFVRCLNRARAKGPRGEERLLAVGNPEFDRKQFPNLSDLDEARHEAEGSSAFYYNPVVLTGARASEPAVRDAMKNCSVAHLASHCLVDQQSAWLSAIVLAPEKGASEATVDNGTRVESNLPAGRKSAGDEQRGSQISLVAQTPLDNPSDGLLHLSEVYNLNLPSTRLVVLSACETGLGQYYRGEGIVSLIHPFLAARVSTVVASLWPIESHATSELMIDFHKERSSSKRSGDALRAAQLRMIGSADFAHPYYWAPFIVVGGDY
jgi:CHAT domain-containing protein/Flp pilus assembly protein TadD